MNRKLPYEQLIADKLRDLHLPGKEDAWQKMKTRLDEEMPEADNERKKGWGQWRNTALMILLLTGAITITLYLLHTQNHEGGVAAFASPETSNTPEHVVLPADEPAAGKDDNNARTKQEHEANKNTGVQPGTGAESAMLIAGSAHQKAINKSSLVAGKTDENNNGLSLAGHNALTVNNTSEKKNADRQETVSYNEQGSAATDKHSNNDVNTADINAPIAGKDNADNKDQDMQTRRANTNSPEGGTAAAYNEPPSTDNEAAVADTKEIIASLAKLNNNVLPGLEQNTVLTVPDNVWQLPDVTAQKKAIVKAMKRQERKEERELSRSYKTQWSFWGNQTDRWFAAGIAPYQNFAIASQETYNYNSGAGRNMIADYIPSPYLQLHVTDRIYLLSEFQFNSPQATSNLLLAQNKATIPMNNTNYTENVYLRKLYYFNMPVSFYYSPVKNFYLGSGLQFSSFNSGLAYSEQRSQDNTLLQSQVFKIKDDSLSSKINASEWRYLFDANYYVDRFMFGFRYNQALNNFVNLKVNNILPPTQARNQAFQFYIRYNLVVSKRN